MNLAVYLALTQGAYAQITPNVFTKAEKGCNITPCALANVGEYEATVYGYTNDLLSWTLRDYETALLTSVEACKLLCSTKPRCVGINVYKKDAGESGLVFDTCRLKWTQVQTEKPCRGFECPMMTDMPPRDCTDGQLEYGEEEQGDRMNDYPNTFNNEFEVTGGGYTCTKTAGRNDRDDEYGIKSCSHDTLPLFGVEPAECYIPKQWIPTDKDSDGWKTESTKFEATTYANWKLQTDYAAAVSEGDSRLQNADKAWKLINDLRITFQEADLAMFKTQDSGNEALYHMEWFNFRKYSVDVCDYRVLEYDDNGMPKEPNTYVNNRNIPEDPMARTRSPHNIDNQMYLLCQTVWDIRKEKESEKAKINYYNSSTKEEDRIAFNLSWAKSEVQKAVTITQAKQKYIEAFTTNTQEVRNIANKVSRTREFNDATWTTIQQYLSRATTDRQDEQTKLEGNNQKWPLTDLQTYFNKEKALVPDAQQIPWLINFLKWSHLEMGFACNTEDSVTENCSGVNCAGYRGKQDKTVSGKGCVNWQENHRDQLYQSGNPYGLNDNSNKSCRNPPPDPKYTTPGGDYYDSTYPTDVVKTIWCNTDRLYKSAFEKCAPIFKDEWFYCQNPEYIRGKKIEQMIKDSYFTKTAEEQLALDAGYKTNDPFNLRQWSTQAKFINAQESACASDKTSKECVRAGERIAWNEEKGFFKTPEGHTKNVIRKQCNFSAAACELWYAFNPICDPKTSIRTCPEPSSSSLLLSGLTSEGCADPPKGCLDQLAQEDATAKALSVPGVILELQAQLDSDWTYQAQIIDAGTTTRDAWVLAYTGDKSDDAKVEEAFQTFTKEAIAKSIEDNKALVGQLPIAPVSSTGSQGVGGSVPADALEGEADFVTEASDTFLKVAFEGLASIAAVRVKTSSSLAQAQALASATIKIGEEECATFPSGLIDAGTWYKVACSKPIIGGNVTIARKDKLVINSVQVVGDAKQADPLITTDAFNRAKVELCAKDANSRECLRADKYRDDRIAFNTEKDFYNQDDATRTTLDEEFTNALKAAQTKLVEDNSMNDQDALTLSTLTGSRAVQSSVPGDATDGSPTSDFSTKDAGKPVFWSAMMDTFVTVDAVRVRTSNIFTEAVKLQSAQINIGTTKCGKVPDEVNESTWYRVSCDAPLTSNSVKVESIGALVFPQIQVLKAKVQDADAVAIALFDVRPAPAKGGVNFRCEKDGDTRPRCNESLCCGHAFDPADVYKTKSSSETSEDPEVRLQVETCQDPTTETYTYEPTWDSTPTQWTWECLEPAAGVSIVATAAAFLGALISQI